MKIYSIYFVLELALIFILGLLWGVDGQVKQFPIILVVLTVIYLVITVSSAKRMMNNNSSNYKIWWWFAMVFGLLYHGGYLYLAYSDTPFCTLCP